MVIQKNIRRPRTWTKTLELASLHFRRTNYSLLELKRCQTSTPYQIRISFLDLVLRHQLHHPPKGISVGLRRPIRQVQNVALLRWYRWCCTHSRHFRMARLHELRHRARVDSLLLGRSSRRLHHRIRWQHHHGHSPRLRSHGSSVETTWDFPFDF